MRRCVILAFTMGLLSVACSSNGETARDTASDATTDATGDVQTGSTDPEAPAPDPIDGCVPGCNPPGIVQPGSVPEGPYETQWFFGGEMVVSVDEPWSVHEDSTGEFALDLDETPENGVYFWEDVYPVENDKRVRGVPMSVDGLLDWIAEDPRLEASAPRRGRLGHLPATIVDVSISKGTENEDTGCPTDTCVLWLGFPQWDGSWGIAAPQVQRLYLSDVTYGGKSHLFIGVVYPDDPDDMETFLPHGEQLLASVQVPAEAN